MGSDWASWLAAITQPAFLLDPASGDIIAANEQAAAITGYTRSELSGLAIRDLHPFEMARFSDFAARALERGMHRSLGLTCRHRSGRHIAAEICATRVDMGDRIGLLALVQPVTQTGSTGLNTDMKATSDDLTADYNALQERLAATRYLLDHAPEMVLWVRPDGSIAYANLTAANRLGVERSELERLRIWDVDTHASPSGFPEMVQQFREGGGAAFETEMVDGQGQLFPTSVSVKLVKPGDDEYLVSFSRDITEEIKAREESRRYLSELATVARRTSMAGMASALSHEINQPLTSIQTYCQSALRLLNRDSLTPERLQVALESILGGTERTVRIVGKLREYMKDWQPRREQVELQILLDECQLLLGPEARHQSIKLVVECRPQRVSAYIDRILIQQVILNLARNGIEAMRETPTAQRQLSVHAVAAADGEAIISVRDTGPGIAPEMAERLFEPFASSKEKGMGIGLSLCRSIVESHGGALWLDSTAVDGASFRFSIPGSQGKR